MSFLQLPALNTQPPAGNLPVAAAMPSAQKNFIILHTVDVAKADKLLFASYGPTIFYDWHVEGKLLLSQLTPFHYLFLDMRIKEHRVYYDMNDTSGYNVVAYISIMEQFDSFVLSLGAASILTAFPAKQHLQADFNTLLVSTPTPSPNNKCLSVYNYISSCVANNKIAS